MDKYGRPEARDIRVIRINTFPENGRRDVAWDVELETDDLGRWISVLKGPGRGEVIIDGAVLSKKDARYMPRACAAITKWKRR